MQKVMPRVHEALEGSPLRINLKGVVPCLTHALNVSCFYVTKTHEAVRVIWPWMETNLEPWNFSWFFCSFSYWTLSYHQCSRILRVWREVNLYGNGRIACKETLQKPMYSMQMWNLMTKHYASSKQAVSYNEMFFFFFQWSSTLNYAECTTLSMLVNCHCICYPIKDYCALFC